MKLFFFYRDVILGGEPIVIRSSSSTSVNIGWKGGKAKRRGQPISAWDGGRGGRRIGAKVDDEEDGTRRGRGSTRVEAPEKKRRPNGRDGAKWERRPKSNCCC
jgi:hypothetical protein